MTPDIFGRDTSESRLVVVSTAALGAPSSAWLQAPVSPCVCVCAQHGLGSSACPIPVHPSEPRPGPCPVCPLCFPPHEVSGFSLSVPYQRSLRYHFFVCLRY